ncbi:MAG TPA: hypothetical protein VFR41_03485, partial [Acidimicrobiia bacterium]|nr:hypothetical protein [Acidimicrobiia bacterium]
MRRMRRVLLSLMTMILFCGSAIFVSAGVANALAINGFEINDGNIADNPASPIHDWGSAFAADGSPVAANLPPGTAGASFVDDPLATQSLTASECPGPGGPPNASAKGDPTVFGSTSDVNGDAIPTYTFKAGSIPNNKDDLSNTYAIAAPDPDNGHLIIYFGLERVDNNGDSHIDFEFLKQGAGLVTDGYDNNGCANGHWSGSRSTGDFLVSLDYTVGGTTPNISFRRWDGTQYVIETPSADAMGITTNSGPISCGPWTCHDTTGAPTTTIATNTFAEGWIDTGDPAVDFSGCVSTLDVHSRSAQSFTSQLKDFVLLPFHTCDAKISIGNNGTNEVGNPHTVTGHVDVNPGGGFVNAPAGTEIDFSIASGPGNLSASSCLTIGTTGSCSVTLNSSTAGVTIVNATSSPTVNGSVLTRTTDGQAGNSGPLTKTWVDANISVGPTAVNEVNHEHTITAHVNVNPGTGFVNAPDGTVINFTNSGGSLSSNSCTTSGGTGSCSVTLNSSTPAVITVSASTTVLVGGVSITRATDSTHGSSGAMTKTYVDARISVGNDGTNEILHDHTVTGHVDINNGTGWVNAPNGTTITFAIASGPGNLLSSSCQTSGGTGSCSVQLHSTTAGITQVNASSTVTVLGVQMTRTTNGQNGNSGPLTKTWVDANIQVGSNATNVVGDPHTVTGHVNINPGTGFVNAPIGTVIHFNIVSGPGSLSASQCTTTTTSGSCSVTLNSPTAGVTTVHATTSVVIGGVTVNRATDGTGLNSGDMVKTYVDARISISPNGINEVNHAHTFTGHVDVNDGSGWANAPAGTEIDFTIASGPGTLSVNSCLTIGTTGSCTTSLNSSLPGVTQVGASTNVVVGGKTVSRTTNGANGNSGPATKTWVDANIQVGVDGVNKIGDPHTVTGHVNVNDGSGWTNAPAGTTITFSKASGPGTLTPTSCQTVTNTGSCSVTLTSSVAGITKVNASVNVTVNTVALSRTTDGLGANSGPLTKTWVDANIQIGNDGTNALGSPHTVTGHVNVNDGTGFTNAPAGTEIDFSIASGPGQLSAASCLTIGTTGSCSVTLTNTTTTGVTVVNATSSPVILGVTVPRSTNGVAPNSGPLHKTWVNAGITIGNDGVNEVGHDHTVTGHVTVDPGTGPQPAPDGTTITFAIASGPGNLLSSSCQTSGGTGSCS